MESFNNYVKIIDGKLMINDGVTSIKAAAFSYNNLTNVEIPYGVTIIEGYAFSHNNLTSVDIPNSVTSIGECAFSNNNLTNIEISNSVTNIGEEAFSHNNLTNIEIPDSVIEIKNYAFSNNSLVSIKLPNSIMKIENGMFFNNNLISVEIPNSVTTIGTHAFANNNLTSVEIPSSVTSIGNLAFDNIDIIYDGIKIDKLLIGKYGCENIIKLYNISKVMDLDKLKDAYIPKHILQVIPVDNDSIKSYFSNYKKYKSIIEKFALKDTNEEIKDIFKMCYVLGLFRNDITEEEITNIISSYTLDYIHQMWTTVNLTKYNPKFKNLFIKLYKEDNLEYKEKNIAGRLYNTFDKINKYTIKRHEGIISKKNTERIRLEKEGKDSSEVSKEINLLKKNIKNITYEDICYYINNNIFDIRENNEAIKDVVSELSIHIEQEEFDRLQDLYEESRNKDKNIPLTKDKSDSDITYHWSKSDNPINLILGYLVNCCAKLGGAGEDIMIQSMINPDIANLIIYDENKQVLGKATAYFNKEKKYILFNNAEMKVTKELKNSKERRKELLSAILRAVNDVTKEFKKQGININEVRMGMERNDLEEAIKEAKLEIELNNLFANYSYKNYAGDANGNEGQAVLYKDNEINKDYFK